MLRPSPSSNELRDAFRLQTQRRQRQSDGTISLAGVRFEIPSRYRHFREVWVRYGMARELAQLDEKCFLEVFQPPSPRQASKKKARTGR